MKLVIDTNKIIAALIKNGLSRQIITNPIFSFITPDHTLDEISSYETVIRKKGKLSKKEFDLLFALLFGYITIIPKEEYTKFLPMAQTLIEDVDDVPFIALCLAVKTDGIWSDDTHFHTHQKFMIFRTKDLISLL
ncbi:MAG: PIN domain-containing protein [Euryarchaeota archaeon]|nr:PIN domain-containing protein [Euryarchaeota archaeon]